MPRMLMAGLMLLGIVWVREPASQAADPPTAEELTNNPRLFLESARKRLKWDEPAEPARIVGPVYFIGTKGLCVYLVTGSEGQWSSTLACRVPDR